MPLIFYKAMNLFTTAATTAAASSSDAPNWDKLTSPIMNLINSMLWPLIGIVGAIGSLYCVLLGVKFAKAEEPQDHEKAKKQLKNAIIGFVLIFVLLVALKLGYPIMKDWFTSVTA